MFLFLKTYKKYAKSIKKRLLDYWAKLYRTNIKKGKQYGDLRKTIVILIANFELEQLKSKKLYQTRWK
ncbi:MAG: PD-(D/E)XK nuclease family transposase, partial [Clostridia bacterium]|nr:PD-(D/E)XK nuclease family transposase [Clostridia bacterium]